VGIVLGQRVGDHQLVALDIDAIEYEAFEAIARAAPCSPMVKRGRKGETRFYLAPLDAKTRQWRDGEGVMLCELLTGQQTRQTVVPPSIHPESHSPYVWLQGPVAPQHLPVLTAEVLAALIETIEALGGKAPTDHPPRQARTFADGNFWDEVKDAALADLAAWVPALNLYGLRRARGGYEAVATWRESGTGRPLPVRKRNLSVQPSGIKDFGTGDTYTAIDLVMCAKACGQEEATAWLRERLGLAADDGVAAALLASATTAPAVTSPPLPSTESKASAKAAGDASVAEIIRGARVGLLGAVTDWVLGQSRRPQPLLALGAALTIIGAAAARRYSGPTRSATHLYILALAPSGKGKDAPLQAISSALTQTQLKDRIGPGEFISFPAIINRLCRHPISVSPIDEFGVFLKRLNSKAASNFERGISGVMRQLWSRSFADYLAPEWAQRAAPIVHAPHFAVYGVSTHQELYTALDGGDIVNGFLNRFLLLSTHDKSHHYDVTEEALALPGSIANDLRRIAIDANPLVTASLHANQSDGPVIKAAWRDDQARGLFDAFAQECEDLEGAENAFHARSAEMAVRLATLRAIGEDWERPAIGVAGMAWGIALARHSARTMMAECADYMAETDFQAQCNRVKRLLAERGEMTKNQLTRALQHRMKSRDLQDVLTTMLESGAIVARQDGTGGRPVTRFGVSGLGGGL
jgi:hypothetical protein